MIRGKSIFWGEPYFYQSNIFTAKAMKIFLINKNKLLLQITLFDLFEMIYKHHFKKLYLDDCMNMKVQSIYLRAVLVLASVLIISDMSIQSGSQNSEDCISQSYQSDVR